VTDGRIVSAIHAVSASGTLRRVEIKDRHQHSYIEPSDECWFIFEYRAGTSRTYELNQLIFDWKRTPSTAALVTNRHRSKENAISTVAAILRRCCGRQWAEEATWCPIPTSKVIGNPDYDDRLCRTIRMAFSGYDLDMRLLLRQTTNTPRDHVVARRLSSDHLYKVLQVDLESMKQRQLRHRIVLFDDILTSGKHFKCCQRRLREALPEVPVCGLFFARRVESSRWRGVPE
jgi:hypothetical protein